MFVISAYAPPTFLKPVLVWMTCQCEDTGDGAHMLGCFVDALNTDHAMEIVGNAISKSHTGGVQWFEIGHFASVFSAMEIHLRMALDMQTGRSNEIWEAGYDPYLRILNQFEKAPAYTSQKRGKAK